MLLISATSLILALPLAAGEKRPVTAPGVEGEIASRGAKKALRHLYGDETAWAEVTSGIVAGGRDWLRVAGRLLAVATDPAAYDLEAAVGEALGSAPAQVLVLADERGEIAISWVCAETATFEEDPGLEERIGILADREKAVRAVADPALAEKREACLSRLTGARQGLERELREATRKIG